MRSLHLFLAIAPLLGCDAPELPVAAQPRESKPTPAEPPTHIGRIEGKVAWLGPPPAISPFRSLEYVNELFPGPRNRALDFPNPHAPRIKDGSLAGALVELRGEGTERYAEWSLPPVTLEASGNQLTVLQDGRTGPIAIARAGSEVVIRSRDAHLHTLLVRGASHLGLALPPGALRSWKFEDEGLLEVRSGLGFFWMRGHVLVSKHPYVALTGPDGTFSIPQVPEGEYQLVVSHPSWVVAQVGRNVDNLRPCEVEFGPWLRSTAAVRVEAGATVRAALSLGPAP
jgi:hypothetical protein